MKNKLRSKAFWVSVSGAALLLLQTLGFEVDVPYVNEVISAACALLIVLGLMADDVKKTPSKEGVTEEGDLSPQATASMSEQAETEPNEEGEVCENAQLKAEQAKQERS